MSINRPRFVFCLKLLVSIVFLYVVFRSVDLKEMSSLFVSIDLFYFLILLMISAALIVVSCLKWLLLLKAKGVSVSLWYLSRLYMLGFFFNNFLPGMVGGDLARGFFLGRRIQNRRDAYLSVLMERLTGFLALVFLTVIIVFSGHPAVRDGRLRLFLFAAALMSVGMVIVMFSRFLFSRLLAILPKKFSRFRDKCNGIHEDLCGFKDSRLILFSVIALSLLYHLLTGLNLYYACLTLNFKVSLIDMIIVTPLIIMVSLIPITPNQLGLWEGSFIVFFSLLGIPRSVALSAALLTRFKSLLVSVLGGLVYWDEGKGARIELKKRAQEEKGVV